MRATIIVALVLGGCGGTAAHDAGTPDSSARDGGTSASGGSSGGMSGTGSSDAGNPSGTGGSDDGGTGKFTRNVDTVIDAKTGLTWQRNLPATYAGCSGNYGVAGDACAWGEAKTYCSGLSLAGGGWRLPTGDELLSIVDKSRGAPPTDGAATIDLTAFPNTPATLFWTSSPYHGLAGDAEVVNFINGTSGGAGTNNTEDVRCVR